MRLTLLFLFTLTITFLHAQTTLTPGDLAVVGFASDNPDEVCLVALAAIDAGTAVEITDKGWESDNTFRSFEGITSVTLPALAFGDVHCLEADLGLSLSPDGDQVFLFTGSSSSPTFIYAFQFDNTDWLTADEPNSNQSYLPQGTVDGSTAFNIGAGVIENGYYSGSALSDKASALTAIANAANWTTSGPRVDPNTSLPGNLGVLLPVSLSNLTANIEEKSVMVTWSTATESENDFFAVERSVDGTTFAKIGEVSGAGNSAETTNYDFIDDAPVNGTSYYRLRQVDFNGAEALFGPVAVTMSGLGTSVYPNPVSKELFLRGVVEGTNATVLDMNGRVLQSNIVSSNGIDVRQLRAGAYLLRLESGTGVETLRFVRK